MSKPPTGRGEKTTLPAQKRRVSESSLVAAMPAAALDEAARLLVDADSFVRLGLIDKALTHLAGALRRDPSLHVLREPLVKLYVTQRQYDSAIAELWALLSPCENPQEEIRYLRYILRLGDRDPAAERRLQAILSQHQLEPPSSADDAEQPQERVLDIGWELREFLDGQRPPTDLARTKDISDSKSQGDSADPQAPPSAATFPNSAEVEAVAEEIALSSDALKSELREIDGCLQQLRYAEALRRLRGLSGRYPHSKRVLSKLQQLERALSEMAADLATPAPRAAEKEAAPDMHSAATLPPRADSAAAKGSGKAPGLTGRTLRNALLKRQTIEVTPDDIQEERALPVATPPPRRPPPPPPRSAKEKKTPALSESERALRTGATMRSFGQHKQALEMFDKARHDPAQAALAALMAGLCYRDLSRRQEAIASFKLGINMPGATEAEITELLYELGYTYELLSNPGEAILYYRLSLGATGSFRDAAERIASLQKALLKK